MGELFQVICRLILHMLECTAILVCRIKHQMTRICLNILTCIVEIVNDRWLQLWCDSRIVFVTLLHTHTCRILKQTTRRTITASATAAAAKVAASKKGRKKTKQNWVTHHTCCCLHVPILKCVCVRVFWMVGFCFNPRFVHTSSETFSFFPCVRMHLMCTLALATSLALKSRSDLDR